MISPFSSFHVPAASAASGLSDSFGALTLSRCDSENLEKDQMTSETQALMRSDPEAGMRQFYLTLANVAKSSTDLIQIIRQYLVLNVANPSFCIDDIDKFNAYHSAGPLSLNVSSPISCSGAEALTLTPEVHQTLLLEGHSIRVLNITSGYPERYYATPAQIHKIAFCCPQLKELRVSITKPSCKELVHCKALEKLVLSCPKDLLLTDALSPLLELPKLTSLTIKFPLDQENAVSLAKIRTLDTLTFDGCRSMEAPTLYALSKIPNLKVLHFIGMDDITDEKLLLLQGCEKLRELHLTECPLVTDRGCAGLVNRCKQLEISISKFLAPNTPDVTPRSAVKSSFYPSKL